MGKKRKKIFFNEKEKEIITKEKTEEIKTEEVKTEKKENKKSIPTQTKRVFEDSIKKVI